MKKSRNARTKRRSMSLLLVGAAVAVALIVAVVAGGGGGPSDFTVGAPVVDGSPLPRMGGAPDPAIGMIGPVIEGTGFDGEAVAIHHDGIAKGIVFLAHWCPHCRAEVPRVQEWLDGGGAVAGADIISVVTRMEETQVNYPPSDWLKGEGWKPPVIVDDADSSVHQAYGEGGFPYWVFLNGDGVVVRRTEGELPTDALVTLLQQAVGS